MRIGAIFRTPWTLALAAGLAVGACAGDNLAPASADQIAAPDYLIGPGDGLSIFVWRNPELSISLPVRPDGKISTPLVEDVQAAGKTPTRLARDLEDALKKFIQDPIVTVIATNFVGPFDQQIRVVGEAQQPAAIPYRENMTILDVMIAVGGLTDFASGNRAVLVRGSGAERQLYRVRLDDLLKDGDVSANVQVLPGDVLIVPESWF
jgi:polysaccharide biosynthesis/export protein